jgi:hypothetical protein
MFPDVPFDETMFDSNEMMKNYWNRATENRPAPRFSDAKPRARNEDDELIQLSNDVYEGLVNNLTAEKRNAEVFAFGNTASGPSADPSASLASAPSAADAEGSDARAVREVSSNTWSIWIFGLVAVVLFFWFFVRNHSRT